jgi:hypothetical protein
MEIITTQNACRKNIYRKRDIRDRKCSLCGDWIARKSKSGMCLVCLYLSRQGEGNSQWKGNKASGMAINRRAIYRFGNANKCESTPCHHKKTKNFGWVALKKDSIKREDFKMLCKRCMAEHYGYGSVIKSGLEA